MNSIPNSISLVIGKRQSGKTTKMAQIIIAFARQTVIDVLVGHQWEKEKLLSLLPESFNPDIIQVGEPNFRRNPDATHIFITTGISNAELFSQRDIQYYIGYANNFLALGYAHVTLEGDVGSDFNYNPTAYPEISNVYALSAADSGLYCQHHQRLAVFNPPAEEVREVEGTLVD